MAKNQGGATSRQVWSQLLIMIQRNEQFVPDYLRNKYGPPVLALGGARTDRPLTSSVERRYGDKLQQCASLNQLSGLSPPWARLCFW
jgi:hypothetical protein